eukprot:182074-Karenia_brevis.AAC.1
MDDESSIFGDSEDSSGSMSSRSHEDSTDAEKDLSQDVLVEEPPPEAVLLGTVHCDPKPAGFHFPETSDEEEDREKKVPSACDHEDLSSDSECVDEGAEFSDTSDDSDVFHVEAAYSELPRTEQDAMIRIVRTIVPHLREYPLLP